MGTIAKVNCINHLFDSVGVGFDTKGAGSTTVKGPNSSKPLHTFVIPDSREGWVESVKLLLDSYFQKLAPVDFDYSKIRLAGAPIKGFGGVSSGPQVLKTLHEELKVMLNNGIGKSITITHIVDIMNMIGKCVVSGNVRIIICFYIARFAAQQKLHLVLQIRKNLLI